MSDWSSYEGDKEIADKWRQFLTEDKQLDEGVLDTVKAKASAARTKAAAATGAAKKGIGKVTGTKAAAARNIKARKVSDWLHGKPQKMRTMNTKFGTGAGQAGGSQSGGSESPGTGVSSRAADPDFDASEKKYLGAEGLKHFNSFMTEMVAVVVTRIVMREKELPESTQDQIARAGPNGMKNYKNQLWTFIQGFCMRHLGCNGYIFEDPPPASNTEEPPAEETAEPVEEARGNKRQRKKANQKKQDAAAKAKADAARARSMAMEAAKTCQKGAVPISGLEAYLKTVIDEETANELAQLVWASYFRSQTDLANT